eukprot:130960-Chlamydomonas_euryale.AAC.1
MPARAVAASATRAAAAATMGTWARGWGARGRLPTGKFTSLQTASSLQTDRVFSDGRVIFQT